MTGTTTNIGFLALNTTQTRNGFMDADGTTKTDIFSFSTGAVTANVAISTTGSTSSGFALSLFRDANGNGVLDNADSIVRANDNTSDFDGANESLNVTLSQGTYFARLRSFATSDISYTFRARRDGGNANPFTTPEIPLGKVSQDLRKSGRIDNGNNADNYAFRLDGKSELDIKVVERGKKTGDVSIRVVQDLNSNGEVDAGEVVVQGVSSPNGNIDKILNLEGKGNYILQVCQTQGVTPYAVKFDHSSI